MALSIIQLCELSSDMNITTALARTTSTMSEAIAQDTPLTIQRVLLKPEVAD